MSRLYDKIIKRKKLDSREAEELTLFLNLSKLGLVLNTKTRDSESFSLILYAAADILDKNINDIAKGKLIRDFYFCTKFSPEKMLIDYFLIATGLPYDVINTHINSIRETFFRAFVILVMKTDYMVPNPLEFQQFIDNGAVKPITFEQLKGIGEGTLVANNIFKTLENVYVEKLVRPVNLTLIQKVKNVINKLVWWKK